MPEHRKYVIAIAGPTAVGKTELAIQMANFFCTEVISCDSRQFFKEMNIGTAKPSPAELERAKHHFIGHKSISETYTCGDFEVEALACLERIFENHNVAIVVGGSGLYMNALIKGMDAFPPVQLDARKKARMIYENQGLEGLQTRLRQLDPLYAEEVDMNNKQRLMRAIEVSLSTGRPFSSFRTGARHNRSFETILLGLNCPREELYARINARVDQMIASGLIDEAKSLIDHRSSNALQTVGYSELFRYFDGEIDLPTAIELIKQNTRRYAKRQLTWLRRETDVQWLDVPLDIEATATLIKKQMDF
ncbi:MAG TPA: tRNA (adenosine(37)-N6)-dimethylallyltransferase MiaA [Luteibaculaceae bacterium]|nr:tRNA (adenosine(37)-N6)-dimethylallyltransferase MiaA [Luteibaculaceae bacterium]